MYLNSLKKIWNLQHYDYSKDHTSLIIDFILKKFSIQFSCSVMSDSLRPHRLQHARPPYPSPTPGACSDSCLVFSNESVLPIRWPKYQSFSFGESVLPMNIQDWFPLGLTALISCNLRDSQESSPTPQFKSINSSELSFLYGPVLTSIHDYWKNHSFD